MQRNNKKKICLVVSSLGQGGVERSASLISIMLSDLGYDVHIVSVLNVIEYTFKGTLLNLGLLKSDNDNIIKRFQRFKVFKNYLTKHNFDVIIDSRSRPMPYKEFLIQHLIYKNQNVAFIIHSYNLHTYLPKSKLVYKLFFKKTYAFVAVSDAIKSEVESTYDIKNIQTIYNAVDIQENLNKAVNELTIDYDYVLFFGRLVDKIKNISLLLNAYKKSELAANFIKLIILGNGPDELKLKRLVEQENLVEYVKFIPFQKNPFPYIKKAKFTLLTSKYEGFPMVIPEALSLNTPVISVDCKSGPNEIIIHKENGLLVENYNEKALSEAMNSFIFDNTLYNRCKSNAKASIEKFSMEQVSEKWNDFLNEIS